MNRLLELLEGKKTLIGAIIIGLSGFLFGFNLIDKETEDMLRSFGFAVATFGLYSMIKRNLKGK